MPESRVSWKEVYLIADLYSAWFRVFTRWLYAEGMYCTPTTTIQARSPEDARRLAKAWEKNAGGSGASVTDCSIHVRGREVTYVHGENFEVEEASCYTDAIESLRIASGRQVTVAPVYCVEPAEFPAPVLKKLGQVMGPADENEEDHVVGPRVILGFLRHWGEMPKVNPAFWLAITGKAGAGGMTGLQVQAFDEQQPHDITKLMMKAVADTQAFMKQYEVRESSFWVLDEISWEAPSAAIATTIARLIKKCQGSATAKGARIEGPAGEIWSVVSWLKHARWGGLYQDYGKECNDPRIPELTGEKPTGKGRFVGEVVCFTGKLDSMEREDAWNLVVQEGGGTASTVTSDVTLVVATREASSKRTKAEQRGIPIIDEKTFLARAGR